MNRCGICGTKNFPDGKFTVFPGGAMVCATCSEKFIAESQQAAELRAYRRLVDAVGFDQAKVDVLLKRFIAEAKAKTT